MDVPGSGPGKLGGEHAKQPIHAGLVCIDSHYGLDLDRQRDLFEVAILEAAKEGDLVNKALEVFERKDGSVEVDIYDIPESASAPVPAAAPDSKASQ